MDNIKEYDNFEDIITAQPFELVEYFNKNASYRAKFSWLFVPEKSKSKVCLVAHIDTVFEDRFNRKAILKEDGIWSSPQGICGDDRCGVYALLQLYRALPEESKPYLLFTDGEECGGVGASEACGKFGQVLNNVTYFIELDRKGSDDMVFYNKEPKEFRDHIEKYGFVDTQGSFSDISILGRHFNKCSVNLSIGYYNQHTLQETVNYVEMLHVMNVVYDICIDETGKDKVWELRTFTTTTKDSDEVIWVDMKEYSNNNNWYY